MRPGPLFCHQQVSEHRTQLVETRLCIGQRTLERFPYLTKMVTIVQPLPMFAALVFR